MFGTFLIKKKKKTIIVMSHRGVELHYNTLKANKKWVMVVLVLSTCLGNIYVYITASVM